MPPTSAAAATPPLAAVSAPAPFQIGEAWAFTNLIEVKFPALITDVEKAFVTFITYREGRFSEDRWELKEAIRYLKPMTSAERDDFLEIIGQVQKQCSRFTAALGKVSRK